MLLILGIPTERCCSTNGREHNHLLKEYICAIKVNFHLILSLDLYSEVKEIIDLAHSYNLQTIADVKLNDMDINNRISLSRLWSVGFDTATVSSFIGFDDLSDVISQAHQEGDGVIALVHQSDKSARDIYGVKILNPKSGKTMRMYELLLNWVEELRADAIIVGATVPEVIKQYSERLKDKVIIFSPGIDPQGGDATQTLANGSDFLIIGRSIQEAKEPEKEAARFAKLTWQ